MIVYTSPEVPAMRFVSIRELRSRTAEVWQRLADEGEVVITSNGKPVAILSAVSEDDVESSLAAWRHARAAAAVEAMQRQSVRAGTDRMTPKRIAAEIAAARKARAR
jgi:prevent-host-death family protein